MRGMTLFMIIKGNTNTKSWKRFLKSDGGQLLNMPNP